MGYKLPVDKALYVDFIIFGSGMPPNVFEFVEKKPLPDALSNYSIFEDLDTDFEIHWNGKSDRVALLAFRYRIKVGFSF